ncbi:response regulator [Roseovarius rhodophyticola]|uniref:Response regulator n=1 Tax=Roseovarius rhodophyticola TaxID=3080827 RepID=A0ABZ2TAX7_9RHOB|nr:response regulator [Roseovarius sp. W115]
MGPLRVLIVETNLSLGQVWQRHLERHGIKVRLETDQSGAIAALAERSYDVVILNLVLKGSSALAISDLASIRNPETRVIFVTDTSFFSDGSVFSLCPNVCAYLQADTPPDDLTAMVEHYGNHV